MILDTRAAGAAASDLIRLADKRELSPDQIRAIELLKDSTGSHILMGSAADKVSYEASRYGQGLLTYALLAGMKGEVPLEGQQLDVLKWFTHAQSRVESLARGIGGIQKPVLSSPRGRSFPIALLTDDEKRQIQLAQPKPQDSSASCVSMKTIRIRPILPAQIRARLRQVSQPAVTGSNRTDPPLLYLDNVLDELPGALSPRIRYRLEGAKLPATLRILRDGESIYQRELTVGSDLDMAAGVLTDALIAATASLTVNVSSK